MNLLLLGFTARDEAAFALFLKRYHPHWSWQALPAQRALMSLPPADLVLIDLAAHGWAQYSHAACTALGQLSPTQAALLLVSGTDASWAAAAASCQMPRWVWLSKPYRAETLREALQQVQRNQSSAKWTPATASSSPVPDVLAPPPAVAPAQPRMDVSPAPGAGEGAVSDFGPLQLAACLAPVAPDSQILLRALLAGLQQAQPFEMRFTMQHVLLVHPQDGWVASNTPLAVLKRVVGSDVLASAVTRHVLDATQLDLRLHQIGAEAHDLHGFLQALVPPSLLEHTLPTDTAP